MAALHWTGLTVAAICGLASPVFADKDGGLVDQPDGKGSNLPGNKGSKNGVTDAELADMMKDLLFTDGKSNVFDATFLFQSCFGGGMLDDLRDAFAGTNLNWVGGSASSWNQPAHAAFTKLDENGDPIGISDFTGGFLQGVKQGQGGVGGGIMSGHDKNKEDEKETGQSTGSENAGAINMHPPKKKTKSAHAVIWVGDTRPSDNNPNPEIEAELHVQGLLNMLGKKWGDVESVSVTILYGDGKHKVGGGGEGLPGSWSEGNNTVKPATKEELDKTLKDLKAKLNPEEKFFFYSGDHGGQYTQAKPKAPVAPGHSSFTPLEYDPNDFIVFSDAADESTEPFLSITYDKLTDPLPVVFNGFEVGVLSPGSGTSEFDLALNMLQPSNLVEIFNGTQNQFFLDTLTLNLGSVPIQVSVPAPGAGIILLAGLAASTRRRR